MAKCKGTHQRGRVQITEHNLASAMMFSLSWEVQQYEGSQYLKFQAQGESHSCYRDGFPTT